VHSRLQDAETSALAAAALAAALAAAALAAALAAAALTATGFGLARTAALAAAALAAAAAFAVHGHMHMHGECDAGARPGGVRRRVCRKPSPIRCLPSARRRHHQYVGQPILPPLWRKRPVPERPHCLVGGVRKLRATQRRRLLRGVIEHHETQSVLLEQGRQRSVE
jgi:hypothetical protein